jgi:hypothetical protein
MPTRCRNWPGHCNKLVCDGEEDLQAVDGIVPDESEP